MGRGGDAFHSPDVQVASMRDLVQRQGLQEVEVIDDDIDVSGRSFNRKGLDRIRAMVEARQVDVIAVYALSRVGRNLAESLSFIRWLRERGVTIVSATEKIGDTPEDQFMIGMWLNMAELQGNQIGESWARIIERRARRGQIHGPVSQGYIAGPDGTRIPDPILGPAITAMFDSYAAGAPVSEIVAAFALARGKPIDRRNVKEMLRNPVYIGRVVLNSSTGGYIEIPDQHPPLVTPDTWRLTQKRLGADQQTPPRHLEPAYSLTGLGVCLHCGYRVQVMHSKENPDRVRRLFCNRKKQTAACGGVGTPLYDPVEAAVLDEVRLHGADLRGNPAAVEAREAKRSTAWASVPRVERELERTREAMGKLAEAWARGAVSDDAYGRAMAQFTDDEASQVAQLDTARGLAEAPRPGEVVVLVEQLLDHWPDLTDPERNRGLRSVMRSFSVRRARYYREPEAERLSAFRFQYLHGK
jgi:DNA invertase Pin-like site-specific DNA recombinase